MLNDFLPFLESQILVCLFVSNTLTTHILCRYITPYIINKKNAIIIIGITANSPSTNRNILCLSFNFIFSFIYFLYCILIFCLLFLLCSSLSNAILSYNIECNATHHLLVRVQCSFIRCYVNDFGLV